MMVELSKQQIGGMILTVLVLSGGGTYYLQETGSYKNCRGGWFLTESGKYYCESRDIYEWCHHGSEEGSENIGYRCYIGIPVEQVSKSTGDFTTSPDGETCYIKGNLLFGGVIKDGLCVKEPDFNLVDSSG